MSRKEEFFNWVKMVAISKNKEQLIKNIELSLDDLSNKISNESDEHKLEFLSEEYNELTRSCLTQKRDYHKINVEINELELKWIDED